jgi:hypothetical protein
MGRQESLGGMPSVVSISTTAPLPMRKEKCPIYPERGDVNVADSAGSRYGMLAAMQSHSFADCLVASAMPIGRLAPRANAMGSNVQGPRRQKQSSFTTTDTKNAAMLRT